MSETLGDVHRGLCEALKTGIDGLQACELLGGQMSPEGLGRAAIKLPALYLACAGMEPDVARVNRTILSSRWAAFLVVSDGPDLSAGVDMLDRAVMAVKKIQCEFLSADNLYKGDAGRLPINIYVIRFAKRIFR